jgi:hypothetical protein
MADTPIAQLCPPQIAAYSSPPETKLSRVLAAMDAGEWERAFSIASKFGRLGDGKAPIMRAQSALLNGDFYRQIGMCPEGIIEAGKSAMRARFEPMRKDSAGARGPRGWPPSPVLSVGGGLS